MKLAKPIPNTTAFTPSTHLPISVGTNSSSPRRNFATTQSKGNWSCLDQALHVAPYLPSEPNAHLCMNGLNQAMRKVRSRVIGSCVGERPGRSGRGVPI